MTEWVDKTPTKTDHSGAWFGIGYACAAWFFGAGTKLGIVEMRNLRNPAKFFTAGLEGSGVRVGGGVQHKVVLALAVNAKSPADLHGYETGETLSIEFDLPVGAPQIQTLAAANKIRMTEDVMDAILQLGRASQTLAGMNALQSLADGISSCIDPAKRDKPFFTVLADLTGLGMALGAAREKFTFLTLGSAIWQISEPRWQIRKSGGSYILEVKDAPVEQNEELYVTLLHRGLFGNSRLMWSGTGPHGYLNFADGITIRTQRGGFQIDLTPFVFRGLALFGSSNLSISFFEPKSTLRGAVGNFIKTTWGMWLWSAKDAIEVETSGGKISRIVGAAGWRR